MEVGIGFLGFGNIGSGVFNIIKANGQEIEKREGLRLTVKRALVRDINKKRGVEVDPGLFTANPEDVLSDPGISIVAEFMGGAEPAREYILRALEKGKTVVTANKEVIAIHWPELQEAARKTGAGLYFEASVAGGVPIIKAMAESLNANRVLEIMGIINGTTNYILSRMSDEGRSFEEVLAEAKRLGYAEPDPTMDIEGCDTMYKLSILASMAFQTRVSVEGIYREGISSITVEDIEYGKELGLAMRLLAIAKKQDGCLEARVHPTFIPQSHPLAAVRDSYNAIFIKGDMVGNLMFYGRGAGSLPTGSAVVSDIIAACHNRGRHRGMFAGNSGVCREEAKINGNWETEFFLRLTVTDKPGVLAKIAGVFGKHQVSIASVIQKGHDRDTAPLIFVTHKAQELSMRRAVEDMRHIPEVARIENLIRVER